jgi:hypothetical protein
MEDDWVIAQDGFDSTLVRIFHRVENCGYLCGLVKTFRGNIPKYYGKKIAGISNGITSSMILEKIWSWSNRIPYGRKHKHDYSSLPQVMFSRAFARGKLVLADIIEVGGYAVPFDRKGSLEVYTKTGGVHFSSQIPSDKEVLMVPTPYRGYFKEDSR